MIVKLGSFPQKIGVKFQKNTPNHIKLILSMKSPMVFDWRRGNFFGRLRRRICQMLSCKGQLFFIDPQGFFRMDISLDGRNPAPTGMYKTLQLMG